jgi:hypothetical protein
MLDFGVAILRIRASVCLPNVYIIDCDRSDGRVAGRLLSRLNIRELRSVDMIVVVKDR